MSTWVQGVVTFVAVAVPVLTFVVHIVVVPVLTFVVVVVPVLVVEQMRGAVGVPRQRAARQLQRRRQVAGVEGALSDAVRAALLAQNVQLLL